MPTKNPRVNVTFEPAIMDLVTTFAKQEHKSVASFAKELVLEALALREDKALAILAQERDKKSAKRKKDDDAWG